MNALIWHGSRDRFRISHKQLDGQPVATAIAGRGVPRVN